MALVFDLQLPAPSRAPCVAIKLQIMGGGEAESSERRLGKRPGLGSRNLRLLDNLQSGSWTATVADSLDSFHMSSVPPFGQEPQMRPKV